MNALLSKKIVKYIQSLSHKKLRDKENAFIAEGPKIVTEFLSGENFNCKILCAGKDWLLSNQNLLQTILPENVYEIDEISLQKISLLKTPNKVLGVFEKRRSHEELRIEDKLSLMLDDIQDPGNLGTIIRIADWFDIENIICSYNCVDCYNPKVVQAAMGSLSRVNIWYTSLFSFLDEHNKISVYAAALSGTPLPQFHAIKEGIILIGNESAGINDDLLKKATQKITIPKYGNAESLNAAVATGIILSHITPNP
ncbi:MAG TPA: RNA methyltransferase [Ginsengibacter sp.]